MASIGNALSQVIVWLTAYGIWGLLAVSFLDSLIPLPNVVDGLVLFLAYQRSDPIWPAVAAITGSTLGTAVFFLLIRSGRRILPFKRRYMKRLDSVKTWVGTYDFLAILAAAALPPPFPLKAVIISAGLLRLRLPRVLIAYAAGRSLRFLSESILAVVFGEQAVRIMKEHYPIVAVAVVAVLVLCGLVLRRLVPRAGNATGPSAPA